MVRNARRSGGRRSAPHPKGRAWSGRCGRAGWTGASAEGRGAPQGARQHPERVDLRKTRLRRCGRETGCRASEEAAGRASEGPAGVPHERDARHIPAAVPEHLPQPPHDGVPEHLPQSQHDGVPERPRQPPHDGGRKTMPESESLACCPPRPPHDGAPEHPPQSQHEWAAGTAQRLGGGVSGLLFATATARRGAGTSATVSARRGAGTTASEFLDGRLRRECRTRARDAFSGGRRRAGPFPRGIWPRCGGRSSRRDFR